MSILYKTTRFADTFTGDKETNVRVQLLSWDTLDTKAFVEYLADKNNITKGDAYKNLSIGKIGVCCHSGLAERNAEYHVNSIFYNG